MSVIVVGLNHRTAPVELRERVAVPSSRMVKALHDLSVREHLAEVVLLSSSHRTEIYARSTKFHSSVARNVPTSSSNASACAGSYSNQVRKSKGSPRSRL